MVTKNENSLQHAFLNDTNDHIEFGKNFRDIYSWELQLKKESILAFEASFIDLYENKEFKAQFYHKKGPFLFSIVCMPHLDNNIPSNICYATMLWDFKVC